MYVCIPFLYFKIMCCNILDYPVFGLVFALLFVVLCSTEKIVKLESLATMDYSTISQHP